MLQSVDGSPKDAAFAAAARSPPPPPYRSSSNDAGGIAFGESVTTTTTTTRKRTVTTTRRRRRTVKRATAATAVAVQPANQMSEKASSSSSAEELYSELEEEEEKEETVISSHEHHGAFAQASGGSVVTGLGILHKATITPSGTLTPTILVDKPLPDFPAFTEDSESATLGVEVETELRPKRRSASPPPRLRSADPVDELEHETLKLNKSASVRRIKSFGDLLSSKGASEASEAGQPDFQRRASQPDVGISARPTSIAFRDDVESARKAGQGIGLGASPGKPRTLTKRASSLGFVRRGSASNVATTVVEGAAEEASSGQPRVASNATAPPGTIAFAKAIEPDRKRKGSGFSFFSGLLKGKAKETVIAPSAEAESAPQTPPLPDLKVVERTTPIQPAGTPAIATPQVSAPTPASPSSSRRYSIFPSFFRSTSSNAPASGGDTLSPDVAPSLSRQGSSSTITPPLASPSPLPAESPQPLAFSGDTSLPQLPSIDRNLGDITFTGLFEFGQTAGSTKKGKRSRASTRSSIASFLSSSSQPQSASRFRSGSIASQAGSSPQSDYVNCKEEPTNGSTLHRDKTITRAAERVAESPKLSSTPPASSLLALERGNTVRHRFQRSNSASSVVPGKVGSAGASTPFSFSSLTSRPSFNRSRSSSTVHSTIAANGSVRYQGPISTVPLYSPAITVTAQTNTAGTGLEDGLPPAVDDFDFSFFADIAARAGPPSSSGYSSSNPPGTPDLNLDDLPDDLVYAPTNTAIRFSQDSRGSSSGARSLLSTSSPSSTVGKPPSILQKTLRKRANTAGSLLSSSMPPSAAKGPGSPSSAGVSTVSVMATRSARSNSSSRLSSLLTSPTSFLSSSPTSTSLSGMANSPSWFSTRESPTEATGISAGNVTQKDIFNSPTSSYVGSPQLSSDGLNPWSSTASVSIPPSSSFSARSQSGATSPAMASQASLSPTARFRSGSVSAAPARQSVLSLKVEDDDTPESYVERLKEALTRSELATRLSSSGDAFYLAALAAYMTDFDFINDPIDIALRKLLLGLSLPKETQQIDRVMEAFAARYNACNPGLFSNGDQPYILAFSMIMLHTDAFNKAAKSKMTKADYVKNTRIDGISSEILEYIYDNITFSPFVYAADEDADLFSAHRSLSDISLNSTVLGSTSSRDKTRLDVYGLITSGLVGKLRLEAHKLVPVKNPYSYTGTVAFFDCSALHAAFAHAHMLEIPSPSRRPSDSQDSHRSDREDSVNMKITKVGVLDRKDDLLEGGKKASSRKWRPWSVLLSGTQLLFFKDPSVAFSLQEHIFAKTGSLAPPHTESQRVYVPALPSFRPDYIVSLHDSIALYDFTYVKYTNVFRLLQPNGRQILFKAEDEVSLNSWISIINYGASFRSTGIRMRTGSPSAMNAGRSDLPKSNGAARYDRPKASTATSISAVSSNGSCQTAETANNARKAQQQQLPRDLQEYVDETFVFPQNATSDLRGTSDNLRHASRSDIVRSKVVELEAKIQIEQGSLAADLRIVRNLAILTPFTPTARNKIEQALRPVASRIRMTRQLIAKLICYRECLCRDLLAAERDALREKQAKGSDQPSLLVCEGPDQPGAASQSRSRTNDMARSASQDDLARLARSPSLLRRSLTSTSDQASDLGSIAASLGRHTDVDQPISKATFVPVPSKVLVSPSMTASPFAPVKEEEPGQTELVSPVRDS